MDFQLSEKFPDFPKLEEKYLKFKESQLQLGYNLTIQDSKLWLETDNKPMLEYKYIIFGCESMGQFNSRGLGQRVKK